LPPCDAAAAADGEAGQTELIAGDLIQLLVMATHLPPLLVYLYTFHHDADKNITRST